MRHEHSTKKLRQGKMEGKLTGKTVSKLLKKKEFMFFSSIEKGPTGTKES